MWLPLMHPLLRDLARNPGMCPDWESNQRPFGSQAGAQSTEPHQAGLFFYMPLVLNCISASASWRTQTVTLSLRAQNTTSVCSSVPCLGKTTGKSPWEYASGRCRHSYAYTVTAKHRSSEVYNSEHLSLAQAWESQLGQLCPHVSCWDLG